MELKSFAVCSTSISLAHFCRYLSVKFRFTALSVVYRIQSIETGKWVYTQPAPTVACAAEFLSAENPQ